ncbi:bifunctional diguanylate cyclase/phosphodiesterase [Belnapia sp. F-4-1]|uniref:putative bifunctional diguanylate cyclase/phosphodiesterase n=1 Tax=Belnapia sp. F-4-1 TaxID=1545443 RepID=UPI000689738E|nr:EAL domain-containing protein [Belnapia sp. F-4-1]
MTAPPSDKRLARYITIFAAFISLTIAVVVPGAYFWAGHQRETVRAHAKGRYIATQLSELVARNPDYWHFEHARVLALVVRQQDAEAPALHRVLDAFRTPIAEDPVAIAWPHLTVSDPVYDTREIAGAVRTTVSLRKVVVETALAGGGALTLALAGFFALRTLPLRAMNKALERAARLASHDMLTNLPNRVLFHARMQQALALARRQPSSVAVLCLDLDHFKDVNDTLGHAAGDKLLAQVATRLASEVRETDTVARLGGDEFAILQVGAEQPSDAEALARRLIETLSQPFDLDGHSAVIGTSIGIAIEHRSGGDPGRLLREADLALYKAKEEGRGTFNFFETGLNERLMERKQLEHDLRQALQLDQFRLHYQPLVEFHSVTGATVVLGAEALIRWHHPVRGTVRPDLFIPIAETTGLIAPLGDWILREACREAATWSGERMVAVNVSPVQFRQSDFIRKVEAALEISGLAPGRLQLEVTEGIMLTDTDETLATLARLRELGVSLAMDDFGTGYSSLGYLRRFRFDKIKIDQSFVRHLGQDIDADAIVRAVVGMSRAMRIRVSAEGVESAEQAELLRLEGCDELQGFLFGKPMPPEAFGQMLDQPERRGELPAMV